MASSIQGIGDEIEPLLGSRWQDSSQPLRPSAGYERRRQTDRERPHISGEHGSFLGIKDASEYENIVSGMDNPVSVALHICEKQVLRPYMRMLLLVGWQPIFDNANTWWEKGVNILHPLFVVALILTGYVIQYAVCYLKDIPGETEEMLPLVPATNVTQNTTAEVPCQQFLISRYIIPDVLHSLAYAYSFYLLRLSRSEQLPTLMERVFLQTSPTQSGFLSQGRLLRTMRGLLYTGVVWVILSLTAQVIHVGAQFNGINFTWMAPGTTVGRVFLLILMLISFLTLNVVYTVVVVNYCVQCSLLIFYIEGLQEKIRQKFFDLQRSLKEIAEIEIHLRDMNYNTAIALSIVLFNFATMAVLGATAVADKNNGYSILMYVASGMSVLFWVSIFLLPVIQAARLTASCNSLRKLGHEIRVRPFAYKDTTDAELDTFLIFTSSLDMRAKIFLMPIRTSYLSGVVLTVSFVLLLLFQTGLIDVWM